MEKFNCQILRKGGDIKITIPKIKDRMLKDAFNRSINLIGCTTLLHLNAIEISVDDIKNGNIEKGQVHKLYTLCQQLTDVYNNEIPENIKDMKFESINDNKIYQNIEYFVSEDSNTLWIEKNHRLVLMIVKDNKLYSTDIIFNNEENVKTFKTHLLPLKEEEYKSVDDIFADLKVE